VVRNIVEIAVNLIGAAEFVLYLADEARSGFVVAASEGETVPEVGHRAELSQPIEMAAVDARRTVFVQTIAGEPPGEAPQPICCAPFYFRDRLLGALSIYALLSHKSAFSQVDRELFDMLGEQAALAIVSAQAFVTVERKLKTVQRFMDLLRA
jgi:GAF domain-containing protein